VSIYVSITRRIDPLDEAGPSIESAEWRSTFESDSEFRVPTDAELADALLGPDDVPALWLAHPEGEPTWFVLSAGNIDVKNPDHPLLTKMARVAQVLGARLISETGETFDSAGNSLGMAIDGRDVPSTAPGILAGLARWLRGD
jgi:hypothetical protein